MQFLKKAFLKMRIKLIKLYLTLLRLLRLVKRALIQLYKFLPLFIFMVIFIVIIFIIGKQFGWYESFISTIKDFKSVIISVFLTSYILVLINSERTRKRNLKKQYGFLFNFIISSNNFLKALSIVYNLNIGRHNLLREFKSNSSLKITLLDKIQNANLENPKKFWDKEIFTDFRFIKRSDFLNSTTLDLLEIFNELMSESDTFFVFDRYLYKFFRDLKMEFSPFYSFNWSSVKKYEIRNKLETLINYIFLIDNKISEPWRKDEIKDTKIDELYRIRIQEIKNEDDDEDDLVYLILDHTSLLMNLNKILKKYAKDRGKINYINALFIIQGYNIYFKILNNKNFSKSTISDLSESFLSYSNTLSNEDLSAAYDLIIFKNGIAKFKGDIL